MSAPSPSPTIAIIGAGPAGLTLALLLHRRSIPCTVFEYRPRPTPTELAQPCGVLDLHDESGQAALEECGLHDAFLALTGECSEAQRVADMDGNILYADEGELSSRPEISRHALTKLLLDHLPPETIKWSHKLLCASPIASSSSPGATHRSSYLLDFGPNIGTHTASLLIGADGAWSKVRALLSAQITPQYAGVHALTLTIRHVSTRFPSLAAFLGPGSFSALGRHHGVMAQRGPRDSARVYVFLSSPEDFVGRAGLGSMTPSEAVGFLLADDGLLGGWGQTIEEVLSMAGRDEEEAFPGGKVDVRGLYALPVGYRWEHRAGVTLIGDAAHLMCPWAGEGVNLGMWDALELARGIGEAWEIEGKEEGAGFQETVSRFVRKYEEEMFPRVKEKAEETRSNGEMLFGEDAARRFVEFFEGAYGGRPGTGPEQYDGGKL